MVHSGQPVKAVRAVSVRLEQPVKAVREVLVRAGR